MSLRATAFIAALLTLASTVLKTIQFVRYISHTGAWSDIISVMSWAMDIVSMLAISVFLFHLVVKQNRTQAKG